MFEALFIPLNGRQIITFGVYRGNDAKGGMRFAFPPYGPYCECPPDEALTATYADKLAVKR
jgi:hypothetical protein